MSDTPLLKVRDLTVTFPTPSGPNVAVRSVDFDVARNTTLAVVGESGSGKSTTALALLGLQPPAAQISGTALFHAEHRDGIEEDVDLLKAPERTLRRLRGGRIAYIPQNPFGSLDPVYTVGFQIGESLRAHNPSVSKRAARDRAIELLETVGIDNPKERVAAFPHQISGGMRQRVVIAMALANSPQLIIADEPTSALDVTVQAQVLDALEKAREYAGASLILITHDMGVVARASDQVLVMYGGSCVESGDVSGVLSAPRMPYTKGLLGAAPRIDSASHQALVHLPPATGRPPAEGCAFASRCPLAIDTCRAERPALVDIAHDHRAACHRVAEYGTVAGLDIFPTSHDLPGMETSELQRIKDIDGDPVLSVEDLVKEFPLRGKNQVVHAVSGVSFDLHPGETLAIVGESGSGKTTLNRTLARMEDPTGGTIRLNGEDITRMGQAELRSRRRHLQMVLQDSTAALNPKLTIRSLLQEPLDLHGKAKPGRVEELLKLVGLDPGLADRFPTELSGGQRQRVAIARGVAVEPDVMLLDEPVSALDVSVQADILALLKSLQAQLGIAYIFVTHDLGVVRHIADRVAVMYLGRVVEYGSTHTVLSDPEHPYTRALVSAVPIPNVEEERARFHIPLRGEVPAASNPPSGCRFRTRCNLRLELPADQQERCASEQPLLDMSAPHSVACHFSRSDIAERMAARVAQEIHP